MKSTVGDKSTGSLSYGSTRAEFLGVVATSANALDKCTTIFHEISSRYNISKNIIRSDQAYLAVDHRLSSTKNQNGYCGACIQPKALNDVLDRDLSPRIEHENDSAFGSYIAISLNEQRLKLATDPYASIPVYYYHDKDILWASSNLAIILELPSYRRVDVLGIVESMHKQKTDAPRSLFEQVRCLNPASIIDINTSTLSFEKGPYFDFSSYIDPKLYDYFSSSDEADLITEFKANFNAAVGASTENSRVTGLFLSGGVDSSFLAAAASQFTDVRAVHVELPGESNEVEYAAAVSKQLGLELSVINCDREAFRRFFVDTVSFMERPFFLPNTVGLVQASLSDAFQGCDLILDGELADSPFYSSGVSKVSLRKEHLHRNFRLPTKMVDRLVSLRYPFAKYFGWGYTDPLVISGMDKEVFAGMYDAKKFMENSSENLSHINSKFERELVVQTLFCQAGGSGNLVSRVDAAARAAQLYAVLPYTEPSYLRFVLNLPSRHKIAGEGPLKLISNPKWLMKKAALEIFSEDVILRKKVGFGLPVSSYLSKFPQDLLENSYFQNLFQWSTKKFIDYVRHKEGTTDIHFMVGLEIWGRIFCRGESRESLKSAMQS